jgi:GTP pyrophosphokinase
MTDSIEQLLIKVKAYLPPDKVKAVEATYVFAEACHRGQTRLTGEPYITHPLATALILADLSLDTATLQAALLHDVIEDCNVSKEQLAARFTQEIASLVDGVTKLKLIELRAGTDAHALASGASRDQRQSSEQMHEQAESLRKMFVAMAQDIRVVLIKLADRLHNMRTLDPLPPARRLAIAEETLDIYAPLAHRLGIWEIKWQLEDLAFRHLQPDDYRRVAKLLAGKRVEREGFLQKVTAGVRDALKNAGVKAEVYGRPKHIYSIYNKTKRYEEQGKQFSDIYDLFAVRVLVETQADCYHALGVIHTLWHPLPGQFDDYIANPKQNMYQSLHTTVVADGGTPLEIQIRTYEMHQIAEYGVAAHWAYKEGASRDGKQGQFEDKMTWVRQLLEWQREVSGPEEFLEDLKADLFKDQVFVYTPRGDIKELPVGATPLDFAYLVHTDLGHRCVGAKVNGKLVSLDYQLQNGDTVEIVISKAARGPSLDWLNPELGFVRTASARHKIRQWFRRQERASSVERGRELLQRELKRMAMRFTETEVARLLKYDNAEELLEALGNGSLGIGKVAARLAGPEETPTAIPTTKSTVTSAQAPGVRVLGVGDLLTRIAKCCSPLPGDDIIGYITRTTGVTVHKRACPNIVNEDEPERLVPVTWGASAQRYPVDVVVTSWDRVGLLRDITNVVAAEEVNITSSKVETSPDGTAAITLSLETTGIGQLRKLITKLETIRGITGVTRTNVAAGATKVRG